MGAVGISKAYVHSQGPVHILCPPDHQVQGLHQLGGTRKAVRQGCPQLYHHKFALIGNTAVNTVSLPAVAGCNGSHRCPVSAGVCGRHKGQGRCPASGFQGGVDLLPGINPVPVLVCQQPDAGGSVGISEIRMKVVNA